MGGGDGLDRLVKLGQDHGLTVMPHVNSWGYDAKTGVIPNYQEFQLRNADGDLMCYPGGGRWVAETNRLEYMRVDDPRWQEVWFRYIDGLVTRFGLQALYLDQIGTVPDEGTRSGSLQMVERLNASYPQMLLCMELLAEFLTPYIDLHSSWGAPWCGLKFIDDLFPGAFSPITRLLYGDRVIFVQHPGGVAAVPSRQVWTNFPYLVEHGQVGTSARCQELDRLLGAIPCVYLAYNTYGIDPLSSMVLSMA